MTDSAPDAFLFDIGNVLLHFDFARFEAPFLERSSSATPEALQRIREIKEAMEDGQLPAEEFVAEAIRLAGFKGDADDFRRLWVDIFWPNEPMFAVVEALAARGYPLFILSNTNAPHAEHIFSTYPVFRHFGRSIFSHEARASKPHEAIYRLAIESCALTPERTIYVDDLAANVDAGRAAGLRSIAYDPASHGAFLSALAGHGIVLDG